MRSGIDHDASRAAIRRMVKMKTTDLTKILLKPRVSEKGTMVMRDNQYIFAVMKEATKPEIKQAVEKLFQVKVQAVHVCNIKSTPRRFGAIRGEHKGWKKAYVSLVEGNRIDLGVQA